MKRSLLAVRDTMTPVTILEAVAHGPLGAVRSLGRLGIPVHVVDANPWAPAFFSRYRRGRFVRDVLGADPVEAVARLLEIGRASARRSILLPTTDDGALFVASHAAALREAFVVVDVPPGLVRALCNKKEMHHLARRLGIPTAQAVFPRSRDEVLAFLDTAVFPVMLKGIDGPRLQQRCGARMFIVQDRNELLEKYDALEDAADPNLMLQEYIPGGDDTVWMFNGYFDARSECLAGFTGKKIRQYPVHRGATSLGICLRNATVETMTRDFMKAIGYRGILDIGYRFDARDGLYKVLDVNPRIGATFRLFVAENDLDVLRAMYLDMTGQPVPAASVPEGRKWIVEDHDLLSFLGHRGNGGFALSEWARSMRGVREGAYFAAHDPLPLLAMCANDARRALQRRRERDEGRRRQHSFASMRLPRPDAAPPAHCGRREGPAGS